MQIQMAEVLQHEATGPPSARNDLAACHILSSDFPSAIREFEQSYRISPVVVTGIALGEAYWFNRQFADALQIHQWASS